MPVYEKRRGRMGTTKFPETKKKQEHGIETEEKHGRLEAERTAPVEIGVENCYDNDTFPS